MADTPKQDTKSGGFEPSNLTAFERYQALTPILSEGTRAYMQLFDAAHDSRHNTPEGLQATRATLTDMFTQVANDSPMSVEETQRAFHGFVQNGWSGLLTPVPLDATYIANNYVGTWELTSRLTNGGRTERSIAATAQTRARSNIYFQKVPGSDNELIELQVMWNEENHYPREDSVKRLLDGDDDGTFLIAALVRTRLEQIDPYTVQINNSGEIIGNHAHYRTPINFSGSTQIGSHDGYNSLVQMQSGETCSADVQGVQVPVAGMFLLLNVQSGFGRLTYKMSGLPEVNGDSRTMDVVDNYTKISTQQPLIGGWEPLEDYYKRTRDTFIKAMPSRSTLADYDVDAPTRR